MWNIEKPYNILIVDDEQGICEILKEHILDRFDPNVRVFTTVDSTAVNDLVLANKINIVICDIMMPNVSGDELLLSIKEQFKNVQIIMLTGDSTYGALMSSYYA
ncbi:MAG: response regulator, partial [bacterium]